jgi:hypothetical protein
MTFRKDLAFGKQYEKIAIDLVIKNDNEILESNPDTYCKEFDFKTDKNIYEVKADRLTYKTGNMFIEYECSNKLSGISTTNATYWFYFVILPVSLTNYPNNYRVYKIPISALKESITKTTRTILGGDNYKSKGYLIHESIFKDYLLPNLCEG